MKLPAIPVSISVKAATAFIVAAVVGGLGKVGIIEVDPGVLTWIAAGAGFLASIAVKEGVPYVNAWLKRYSLPVDFEEKP
jgi:hypothetical protein